MKFIFLFNFKLLQVLQNINRLPTRIVIKRFLDCGCHSLALADSRPVSSAWNDSDSDVPMDSLFWVFFAYCPGLHLSIWKLVPAPMVWEESWSSYCWEFQSLLLSNGSLQNACLCISLAKMAMCKVLMVITITKLQSKYKVDTFMRREIIC